MKLNRNPLLAALATSAILLAGCGTHTAGMPVVQRQVASMSAAAVTAAAIQALETEKKKDHHAPVVDAQFTTFTNLEVTKLMPDDNDGLTHQQFDVLIDGAEVRVAHNTDLAPHVPVKVGDHVDIRGIYLTKQHVLHWTHYNPEGGAGGFIKLNGKVYDRK
ncbi:MAG: hypothetical protein JWM80_4592 [Cyanobacteria bacterium RYN_339]|nr:hypothetical protein [Cyanobacteria bacterium RYN_339]